MTFSSFSRVHFFFLIVYKDLCLLKLTDNQTENQSAFILELGVDLKRLDTNYKQFPADEAGREL